MARHKCQCLLRQLQIDWRTNPGLARQLSLSITRGVFVSGDIIVHEGQLAKGMHFIVAGRVLVHRRCIGELPVKQLSANTGLDAIFGEMALLNPEGRALASVSVPPRSFCDTFLLRREKFKEICVSYPSFKRRIQAVKNARDLENAYQDEASVQSCCQEGEGAGVATCVASGSLTGTGTGRYDA